MTSLSEEPFLHIGFPKCGSTFLQKEIWPFLKTAPYVADSGEEEILAQCAVGSLPEDLSFLTRGKTRYLYSHEGILDYRLNPLTKKGNYLRRERCLNNLLSVFRDFGRFIVVVRRQDSLAKSFFRFYAAPFLSKPEQLFIDFPASELGNAFKVRHRPGMTYLESFDFNMVLARMASVVGRERIHVLMFEEMIDDPQSFFQRLGTILGEDLGDLANKVETVHNPSSPQHTLLPVSLWRLRKFLRNRFPYSSSVKPLLKREVSFSQSFIDELMDYYREGNREMCETFGVDGRAYGYY